MSEVRRQTSEVRCQMSKVRCQKSGVRGQMSEVGRQIYRLYVRPITILRLPSDFSQTGNCLPSTL